MIQPAPGDMNVGLDFENVSTHGGPTVGLADAELKPGLTRTRSAEQPGHKSETLEAQ